MVAVAVDVGGTFTDFVVLRDDGSIESFKVLTTPKSPEVAVLEGLRRVGSIALMRFSTQQR